MEGDLKKPGTVEGIRKTLLAGTGYKVPEAKAALLVRFFEKKGETMYSELNSASVQLGQLMANHLGVGFTCSAHTADYVPLLASGPGSEHFHGFRQNTEVFRSYLALANIDFRNPESPLLAECGPSAAAAEFASGLA
jgi:alkaline phosphatase